MLSSPGNQYLRPEYLTPLPTTLDAKKSPLALLAQTCSQIGADTPNSKLLQSSDKSSKPSKPEKDKQPEQKPPPPREKSKTPEQRSSSASSRAKTPSKPASTRSPSNHSASSPRASPEEPPPKPPSPKTAFTPNILTSSSDPAIKDLPLGTFKPGAASFMSYPGFPLPLDLHPLKSPFLGGYGRLKSPDLCRDPYCTGCGLGSHLLKSSCPAGCSQCDHKAASGGGYLPPAAYAHAQLAALAAASHLPYVCNWISGEAQYCGKRFSSSEELLAHLRTHTAATELPPPPLLRTYPTPPLSPLATARYHPYSKPSLLPPTLASAFPLGHLPPYLAAPYSIYGARLGAAPGMHP